MTSSRSPQSGVRRRSLADQRFDKGNPIAPCKVSQLSLTNGTASCIDQRLDDEISEAAALKIGRPLKESLCFRRYAGFQALAFRFVIGNCHRKPRHQREQLPVFLLRMIIVRQNAVQFNLATVRAIGPGFIPSTSDAMSTRAGRDGFQPIHLSPSDALAVTSALVVRRSLHTTHARCHPEAQRRICGCFSKLPHRR
jgi:hypothetical protein